jgi:hypothetical protein
MNTIPLIFNQRQVNRTVLGGTEPMPVVQMNVSAVLLNSAGSHYRVHVIENLIKCGFESIVSIESDPENYNIEDFAHRFPSVKFIVPLESVSDGDMINIGMSEVKSPYVLVLRDTLSISPDILTARLAESLTASADYCIVPRLVAAETPSFPIHFTPSVKKSRFTVIASTAVTDGIPTLYPFNGIGLYNRQKFIQLGGFDYTITASYWQNLDLSFRAWLWGEKITLSTVFSIPYRTVPPAEDATANQSSSRFYLKNLVPRFASDHGVIDFSSFLVYLPRSACGFFEAFRQFADARAWVDKNKYRFRFDAPYLVENWGKIA